MCVGQHHHRQAHGGHVGHAGRPAAQGQGSGPPQRAHRPQAAPAGAHSRGRTLPREGCSARCPCGAALLCMAWGERIVLAAEGAALGWSSRSMRAASFHAHMPAATSGCRAVSITQAGQCCPVSRLGLIQAARAERARLPASELQPLYRLTTMCKWGHACKGYFGLKPPLPTQSQSRHLSLLMTLKLPCPCRRS